MIVADFFGQTSAGDLQVDLHGGRANGLLIDNLTNQWLREQSRQLFIPPYQFGMTIPLGGIVADTIKLQAPPNIVQSSPIAGEFFHATYLAEETPAAGGFNVQDLSRPVRVVILNYNAGGPPHATTQRWTYTVPAGRRARVSALQISCRTAAANSSNGIVQAWISYTPNGGAQQIVILAEMVSNAVNAEDGVVVPGGWDMQAGDTITSFTSDNDVGGTVFYNLTAIATEFSA